MNITQGVWQVADSLYPDGERSLAVWSGQDATICLISPKGAETEQDLANANAICNAVNNTYGKNINPEVVPEMLETMKGIRIALLDKFGIFGGGHELNAIFDRINKIVEKAEKWTIKKN